MELRGAHPNPLGDWGPKPPCSIKAAAGRRVRPQAATDLCAGPSASPQACRACAIWRKDSLREAFLHTKKAAFTAALFDEFDSSFNRGAYGANPRASTTRNTAIGVDNILTIAWGNHADRAFALAGATADALIGDNVSHVTNAPPCFLEYTHYSIRPKAMQLQFS